MTQIVTDLIPVLNKSLNIDLPEDISFEQIKEKLSQHVNHLIQFDFQKLVTVLYRIDVNEEKLKFMLEENTDKDASSIIADLIIERQIQKIKYRQQFSQGDKKMDDEDKW